MASNNDILDMYLYETNTLLGQLDSIVLSAEQAGGFSQDDVNEIFRIMHTVKGSSAMMEFSGLMTVAHRIEDLFFIIREKTMDAIPDALPVFWKIYIPRPKLVSPPPIDDISSPAQRSKNFL